MAAKIFPYQISSQSMWSGYALGRVMILAYPSTSGRTWCETPRLESCMFMVAPMCKSDLGVLFQQGDSDHIRTSSSLGSIDESRKTAAMLARLTDGQCLSVGYRLAPQHPFPAAILDTLLVYMSLLYPPPGSPHKPIPPASIVLCGDSAGAAICFAVIQVIIQAQRRSRIQSPSILFHGEQVLLQPPAGLAALSAFGDLTHSMPSWFANAGQDYFGTTMPTLLPNFPECEIWPTKPPRASVLCNETVLHHPLASPIAVADWTDFPPLWLCFGEEMMADESKFIAQRAAQSAVPVVWEQYGSMPHCFILLPHLNRLPQTQRVYEKWAHFCKACVEQPESIKTKGTFISADDMEERSVDVKHQLDLSFEEVKHRMDKARMKAKELLLKKERSRAKI